MIDPVEKWLGGRNSAARRYDRTVPRPPLRGNSHCYRATAMNDYYGLAHDESIANLTTFHPQKRHA